MPMFHVMWKIDLEADTPREAAEKALEIQRNPESIATVFEVMAKGCKTEHVDFYDEEESTC